MSSPQRPEDPNKGRSWKVIEWLALAFALGSLLVTWLVWRAYK
jgi:hypothetical protein